MTDPTLLFDSYSRQARLYPALLTLLPPILMLIALSPGVLSVGQAIVAIVAACGGLFFLADFARTRGKRLESALLLEWGGWPTTIWLRHSDRHLPAGTKARYHAFLSQQLSIGRLPTAEEEAKAPKIADESYAASVMWLKERCRGPGFPLVEKENATYGFRRNLLGLKPIGMVLCLVTVLSPLVLALSKEGYDVSLRTQVLTNAYFGVSAAVLGVAVLSLVALALWLITVNDDWVREAGDQYARALLASCDSF